MILLDCGNGQLKAQWRQADQPQEGFVCNYNPAWPRRLQRWLQELPADHCYYSSVLDSIHQQQLELSLAQQLGVEITRVQASARTAAVINGYHQPTRLGSDRWLALIAAADLIDGDCLIIDAGSAITVDLLRSDGQHLGGAILPGFNTTLERFKQIFSYIDFDHPQIAIEDDPGCSTEAAIHIKYALDATRRLPELVSNWSQHLDANASILLSGGDAYRVQREITEAGRIVPDLVFHGMSLLARR